MLNRRAFLSVATGAAAAAMRGRAVEMGMQLHLSCGALGIKASQMQAIDWAHQFGFDVVDADGGYLARITDDERRRLVDHMKSVHVGWAMAGVPFEYREDQARFTEGMRTLPAYAAALHRAGVERVTTWIMPSRRDRPYIENFRLHAQRLREIARVLGGNDLRFGLEYVGPRTLLVAERYPFVHTMAEMKDLIAEIGETNVGLVLDSWHWYHAGDTAADILGLKPSEVVSVDLNDAPRACRRKPCRTAAVSCLLLPVSSMCARSCGRWPGSTFTAPSAPNRSTRR